MARMNSPQVLHAKHPATWIGVLGQSGHGPGQFTYPRGLAIARELLYVCEERQVSGLRMERGCEKEREREGEGESLLPT